MRTTFLVPPNLKGEKGRYKNVTIYVCKTNLEKVHQLARFQL